MTTITQTITPLPAAPDATTQTPSAYAVTATAFAEALPDLVTEQNTLSGQINTVAGEVAADAVATAADVVSSTEQVALATAQVVLADAAATASENFASAVEWVSGTTYVVGDVVWSPIDYLPYRRIIAGAGTTDPSADATNWLGMTPSSGAGDHYVRLNTANGFGSSSTKVRRFATTESSVGTAITYADSATLGATFTINEAGIYSITYWDTYNSDGLDVAITKNSTALTSAPSGVPVGQLLAWNGGGGSNTGTLTTAVVALTSSDVIRAQTQSYAINGTAAQAVFSIRKVGSI